MCSTTVPARKSVKGAIEFPMDGNSIHRNAPRTGLTGWPDGSREMDGCNEQAGDTAEMHDPLAGGWAVLFMWKIHL